jgi:putative holliday junction resolvase
VSGTRPPTRLLGVDFGSVRVGLAISDPDRKLASPLAIYSRRGREADAQHFRALMAAEEVGGLVVGLPVHLDGREGQKAVEARAFGAWLGETTGLPVVFFDERFTTVQAESALWAAGLTHKRRKERRDKVAAQLLLQAYLDAGCPPEAPAGPLEG